MSRLMPLTASVRGGDLHGGVWEPEGPVRGTILAVHGITSSHLAFAWLAEAMPQLRIIAPDLRGRGRSRDLPGPWGMQQHAEDCLAFLDAAGAGRVLALGHSMGAFVVGALAAREPERIARVVLVDGGLPLPRPEGIRPEDVPGALIGPAADRLSAVYASTADYRAFWNAHPAFAGLDDRRLEAYADYDLIGEAPELRPAGRIEAVAQDSLELQDAGPILARWRSIPSSIPFLRAERGLLDEVPPLYPEPLLARWQRELPDLEVHEIADVNHYTILMSGEGVERVRPLLARVLELPTNDPAATAGR